MNLNSINLYRAFPSTFKLEVSNVLLHMHFSECIVSNITFDVEVQEKLQIPYRLYPSELNYNIISKFNILEKDIYFCLYSRHNNGFIRQKALLEIMFSRHLFVMPYFFQIMGEYVIEILNDIYLNIKRINHDNLTIFLLSNINYYDKIKAKIMSYWNCYYRRQFSKENYVGFKLTEYFDKIITKAIK